MKKIFKRHMPDPDNLRQQRWLAMFGNTLLHPRLWHLNRHSAAGGVAVGLFCGMIPGPIQMLSAALLCVLFRVNLPVALLGTLFSNPLTIVPLYLAAYTLGSWATGGSGEGFVKPPEQGDMSWWEWMRAVLDWLIGLGHPLAIGVVLLAVLLATAGYLVVKFGWRWHSTHAWRQRCARRRQAQG